jgi:hypothetical protein
LFSTVCGTPINRSFNFGVSDLLIKNAVMTHALCSSTSSEKPVLQPGGLAIPLELSVFIHFKMTSAACHGILRNSWESMSMEKKAR